MNTNFGVDVFKQKPIFRVFIFYKNRRLQNNSMKGSLQQNMVILPRKVMFSVLRNAPRSTPQTLYFSIENEPHFQYHNFFDDFGPPSILQLYSFTKMIQDFMSKSNAMLHFYVSQGNQNAKSNSALYITAFRMLHLHVGAEEAFHPLRQISATLKPFRDASTLPTTFDLTVLDCLKGLEKGMKHGWFSLDTFDPEEWCTIERIEEGDMNWIIPHKLLAFASPYSQRIIEGGYRVAVPEDVIPRFKQLGITHVIRLNKQFYDSSEFIEAGFKHIDLYFLDGSTPPDHILDSFLSIMENDGMCCEKESGDGPIVALHCKAGLGRTGTLAGCYLIKDCGFTGRESIGWIRLCRPGSIIGPQQQYLLDYFNSMKRPKTESMKSSGQLFIHEPLGSKYNGHGNPRYMRKCNQAQVQVQVQVHHQVKGRQETARAQIRKPFSNQDKLVVRATAINSFHPQPRKVNQKEFNRA